MSRPADRPAFLIVKLAAAGDVLLTTALARALRAARPDAHIGWLTSGYAAPLLEGNPDLDAMLAVAGPLGGAHPLAAARALARLPRWREAHPGAVVLVGHRSAAIRALLRAAGLRRIVAWDRDAVFDPGAHRLALQAALLRAAGVTEFDAATLRPRLELSLEERRAGERGWAGGMGTRWAIAPGGAANPWSAMPNRRWPAERFLALAREAAGGTAACTGIAVRWLGGPADRALLASLGGTPQACMRETAAIVATADLVIGNDSLPLVLAHALGRPALGLYGPTPGAAIHAPGEPYLQGETHCSPCYDPRDGGRGIAYHCPRARCMEQITVGAVLDAAAAVHPQGVHCA